jgi:hypothetical protein
MSDERSLGLCDVPTKLTGGFLIAMNSKPSERSANRYEFSVLIKSSPKFEVTGKLI